jgi:hypothetical protein
LRRMNFPEPVTLTRLAMAVCVFSFCFMTFFLDGVLQPQIQTITDAPSEAQRSLSPERTPYRVLKEYTIVSWLLQGGIFTDSQRTRATLAVALAANWPGEI